MRTLEAGTEQDAVRELMTTGMRTGQARELCRQAKVSGHAVSRDGQHGRTQLVTFDQDAGYRVSREAEHSRDWTIAWRKRTANRFQRVSDWSGTWKEASDLAGEVYKAHKDAQPPLEVWYVPTAAAELRTPLHEDNANVLTGSGRRVRIVEGGHLADLLAEVPADLATQALDTHVAKNVRPGWVMAGVGRIEQVRSFQPGQVTFIGNRGHRAFGRNDLVEATEPRSRKVSPAFEAGQVIRSVHTGALSRVVTAKPGWLECVTASGVPFQISGTPGSKVAAYELVDLAAMSADDIVTALVQAPTQADAQLLMGGVRSRDMLLTLADQLWIEAGGRGSDVLRKAIAAQART